MVAAAMAAAMVAAARGAAATVWLAEASWVAAFRHGLCCSSYSAACLPTRCPPPFASSKDVEEEVDEKVRARALALAQQPRP